MVDLHKALDDAVADTLRDSMAVPTASIEALLIKIDREIKVRWTESNYGEIPPDVLERERSKAHKHLMENLVSLAFDDYERLE